MYLEIFCMSSQGIPLTELYRLESHTYSEIRSTIATIPFHICLDALDIVVLNEHKSLSDKIKTADVTKKLISKTDISRHAEITSRIERADAWLNSDVSVLLSAETGSTAKVLIWRGKLMEIFLLNEDFLTANIKLINLDKIQDKIHDLDPTQPTPPAPIVQAGQKTILPTDLIDLTDIPTALPKLEKEAEKQTTARKIKNEKYLIKNNESPQ